MAKEHGFSFKIFFYHLSNICDNYLYIPLYVDTDEFIFTLISLRLQFRIGNTENTPLQIASGEGGEVMSVDASGPVFVGVKREFTREKGERQPLIGEDVLTAFNQKYYPEQVGKDNEI